MFSYSAQTVTLTSGFKQSYTSLGNKLCLINFYSILLLRTALILQLIELSVLEVGILLSSY